MKYIYLYEFRGIEATFTVEADSIEEANERVEAMKTARFEGTLLSEIPISDAEMERITCGTRH